MVELAGVPVSNLEIILSANMNLTSLLVNRVFVYVCMCMHGLLLRIRSDCTLAYLSRLGIIVFFIQMLEEPVLFGFHVLTGRSFEVNLPWLSRLTSRTRIPGKKQLWTKSVV